MWNQRYTNDLIRLAQIITLGLLLMIVLMIVASKLYGVNATIIIFVFVLYCIVYCFVNVSVIVFFSNIFFVLFCYCYCY